MKEKDTAEQSKGRNSNYCGDYSVEVNVIEECLRVLNQSIVTMCDLPNVKHTLDSPSISLAAAFKSMLFIGAAGMRDDWMNMRRQMEMSEGIAE